MLALLALLAACKDAARPTAPVDGALVRVVRVEAGRDGFRPPMVEAPRGQPLTIELLRTTDATCATKVVFPELRIERDLPLGTPVDIPIAADRERVVSFQCGMGMYRGSIVVR